MDQLPPDASAAPERGQPAERGELHDPMAEPGRVNSDGSGKWLLIAAVLAAVLGWLYVYGVG